MNDDLRKIHEALEYYIKTNNLKTLSETEFKIYCDTIKLSTLFPTTQLGKYGEYTINQFYNIYNIYDKASNNIYSIETADTLYSLYTKTLELDIDVINDPYNKELREMYYAILNILDIYKNDSVTELPDEERLKKLVKNIIPEKKYN